MSIYSGECDFADELSTVKQHRLSNGAFASDELECFDAFKEQTGGVIYQHVGLKLTRFNVDAEINRPESELSFCYKPNGKKCYKYGDKEYPDLSHINRHGYFSKRIIHFDTLLDLIPYYPYLVTISYVAEDGLRKVIVSEKSVLDFAEADRLVFGLDTNVGDMYRKRLQRHYADVALRYFNPKGREASRTCDVYMRDGKAMACVGEAIDANFGVEITRDRHVWIWDQPKVLSKAEADAGDVFVGDVWPNELKQGDVVTLSYVKAEKDRKLILDF